MLWITAASSDVSRRFWCPARAITMTATDKLRTSRKLQFFLNFLIWTNPVGDIRHDAWFLYAFTFLYSGLMKTYTCGRNRLPVNKHSQKSVLCVTENIGTRYMGVLCVTKCIGTEIRYTLYGCVVCDWEYRYRKSVHVIWSFIFLGNLKDAGGGK